MLTARVPARLSAQEVCMWGNAPIRTRRRRRSSGGALAATADESCAPFGLFFRVFVLFCRYSETGSPDRHRKKSLTALFSHDKDFLFSFFIPLSINTVGVKVTVRRRIKEKHTKSEDETSIRVVIPTHSETV